MDKQELRKIVRAAKKAVPLCDKQQRSLSILQQLEALPQFQQARTVLTYWSMDDEVYTHPFVEKYASSKTILLPCVDGDDLRLRQYTGPQSMQPGPQFGIPEPVGPEFTDLDAIDMIVVPGVAFDKHNNRMGRGRGFYDRLLKSTPKAFKVGIAFDFQIFESIPIEPFDVAMDCVLTEAESKCSEEKASPFMMMAIDEARQGILQHHGGPFGSIIVRNGEIVGRGHNRVIGNNDPTCHGEVDAIRNACANLGTFDLSGCEIYTTGEPCHMCLCACLWANIGKIHYGCTIADNARIGFRDERFDQLFAGRDKMPGFLVQEGRDECLKLFDEYNAMQHENY